ncbi:hypothetical protein [Nocardioides sp. cx-169]|nr:hypothetical protein [Nocardioides sp. cx-169]
MSPPRAFAHPCDDPALTAAGDTARDLVARARWHHVLTVLDAR